ncbi:MAG: tetratricopeptide repeat protein [Gammaproteobacteria bacterium]|nr:tetratricopeptide repeat protein [Gammaproteobacteria bacterium]
MSRRHSRGIPKPVPRPAVRPSATPGSATLEKAWALYSRGEQGQAEELCRSILSHHTADPGAMTLLGIILAQGGRTPEAAELLERVAIRSPEDASAHNNYGNVLRVMGRYGKALACYERAIAIQPDYADAHYNRGVTLHDLRQYPDALASYDRALALKPDYAAAWNNRGATLRALESQKEALASYDRAIAARAAYPEAHNNRGVALQELGRLDEALVSYERALALRPQYAEAHNNRGVALQKLSRLEDALASYDRALACQADYPEAYNGRGVVLTALERFEEAVASLDRALAVRPDYAEAHSNRGAALRALKRYAEAMASHQRALEIDPRCADAYVNLGAAFIDLKSFDEALACYERALALRQDVPGYVAQGSVLHELKRSEEAVASYQRAMAIEPDAAFVLGTLRHIQMQICDWTDYESDVARIATGIEQGRPVARPFNVLSLLDSPALQRKASEIAVREFCTPRHPLPQMTRHPRHDRIRLGYFSADLHSHAVTILTAEMFETHDRSRFELTAFSLGANIQDHTRTRIEPAFDRFLWVGAQSDREIAELSRRLEIDVAIDLGGYTGDARPRIMALRAAPIQVSYLGYLGTMGGGFMDYLIADPIIVPPEARKHYTEKIAYLPSYQVNDTKRVIADKVYTRAELGLPARGFVFCCFNASYKITPDVFASWMRILSAVPDSVLFLVGGNGLTERNLRREAASHGVSAQRLVFGGRVAPAEYLARYRAADLFLDTAPYNAGTTASDALWVGLPVLTCTGNSFAARVAASVLSAAEVPELIAQDRPHYERLAIELASRPDLLEALRRKLANGRSAGALFDTRRITRSLEDLYTRMYDRHLAGLAPEHLPLGQP